MAACRCPAKASQADTLTPDKTKPPLHWHGRAVRLTTCDREDDGSRAGRHSATPTHRRTSRGRAYPPMTTRFVKQPDWTHALLRDERASTRAVYAVLLAWRPFDNDAEGRPWHTSTPARSVIAAQAGVSERMVKYATARLVELGLIRKRHRGAGRAQCYYLAWDAPFTEHEDPVLLLNLRGVFPSTDGKGQKGKKGQRDPVDNPAAEGEKGKKGQPIAPFTTLKGKPVAPYQESTTENVLTHLPSSLQGVPLENSLYFESSLQTARATDDVEAGATRATDDDPGGGVRPQAAAAETPTTDARAVALAEARAKVEAARAKRAAEDAARHAKRAPRPSSAPLPESPAGTKDADNGAVAESVRTGAITGRPLPAPDGVFDLGSVLAPTRPPEDVLDPVEGFPSDADVLDALEPVDVLGNPITDDDYADAYAATGTE